MAIEEDYSQNRTIRLSVRDLVGFVMRHGSIDKRFGGFDRAQQGAKIHRMLQKSAGPEYQKEVTLRDQIAYDGYLFELWGRADGIIEKNGHITIDEIKTVTRDVMTISEDTYPDHWAQAKIYGWMVAKQRKLEQVAIQLTYYQVPSGTIRTINRLLTAEILQAEVEDLLDKYLKWARSYSKWILKRDASIASMSFPFKHYRKGQRQLSVAVFKCAQSKRDLLCQAPTGIGKTLGVLFGAVQALGHHQGERILYGTAKTTGAYAAEQAIGQMRVSGLKIKSVTLAARDRVCFLEDRACYPEVCPYADHYFDRVSTILFHTLEQYDDFSTENIVKIAKREKLCPFEFSLDLSDWCDVIIGDYNYFFDPQVALDRLYGLSGDPSGIICLLDEAHNLPDRVRDMYTSEIKKSDTASIKKKLCQVAPPLKKLFIQLDEKIKDLSKEKTQIFYNPLDKVNHVLRMMAFAFETGEKKLEKQGSSVDDSLLDWYFLLRHYLLIADCYQSDNYVTMITKTKKDIIITQFCLDPADFIASKTGTFRSSIFFSGTLTPGVYYKQLLGMPDDALKLSLDSPFDPSHFKILINDRISTKYKDRIQTADEVAKMIVAFVTAQRGHYFVFFPSYAYMTAIAELMTDFNIPVIKQKKNMSVEAKSDFMKRFDENRDDLLVGFCVMGSYFGEGIDLAGERLIGVVIVGVGLPKISQKNDLLKNHYQDKLGQGFDYAYKYPGFNKVLQAMGRVIRTESDRGMALLIDERFAHRDYKALFPKYTNNMAFLQDEEALTRDCHLFWDNPDKK